MVLSSQAPRMESSRRYMVSSRRRRSGRKPLIIAGVVAFVVVVLAYQFWPSGADENQTGGDVMETGRQASSETTQPASPAHSPSQGSQPTSSRPAVAQPQAERLTVADTRTPPSGLPQLDARNTAAPKPAAANPDTPATQPPPVRPATAAAPTRGMANTDDRVREGMRLVADGKLVQGRAMLSGVLFANPPVLSPADADTVRTTLASINKQLVFSKEVVANDPLAEVYTVQSGDMLSRIAPKYDTPYQFIELINDIDARNLRVGQKIKVIKGPFHARVAKRDYRMDVFLLDPQNRPIYIMSVPVGLGENDGTPNGLWRIKPGSKVKNPDWKNPRTGEYFKRDDPNIPIGEYWMALEGVDDNTSGKTGYGLHGTTDPDSIGDSRSMGCVRLRDADIELMFKMLADGQSTVEIAP